MQTLWLVALVCCGWVLVIWLWMRYRRTPMEKRVLAIKNRYQVAGVWFWVEEGAEIGFYDSVAAIRGFGECRSRARKSGLDEWGEITIAVLRREGIREGIPVFSVPATDKNEQWADFGKVWVAGLALSDRGIIVLPSPWGTGEESAKQTQQICDYEMEHIVLYRCDKKRFKATEHHTIGDGHPLIR